MGYTHYFIQLRDFTDQEWSNICATLKDIIVLSREANVSIADSSGELDKGELIDVENGTIAFNGFGDDSHESMVLTKKQSWEPWEDKDKPPYQFCKTAAKSYDLTVTALLCAVEYYAPGALQIGSDGNKKDWEYGAKIASTVMEDSYESLEELIPIK